MDSAHQTKVQSVYQFCGKHWARNVFASRGFDTIQGETIIVKKERRFGGRRVNMNNDYFKSTIFDRLKNDESGESYIHVPKAEVVITQANGERMTHKTGFTDRFYTGLCSERKFQVKQRLGGYKTEWRKLSSATRNENLDCTVMCFAGWEVAQMGRSGYIERKWREVEKKLALTHPQPTPIEKQTVIASTEIKKPELRQAPVIKRRTMRRMFATPFGRF
jgi:phage terminase large subunit GpA-like protein